jgi:NAD(P)H-dependent FMN reductase
MSAKVLVVSGSARMESNVHGVARLAADAVRAAGAELREHHLHQLQLPVMEPGSDAQAALPAVRELRGAAAWADGFILITPEYHGNMSGCLKNWFDYLYPELAGKFAGVIAVTGGGGGDMSITAVKNTFAWCHGFTLPYHAAARGPDFEDGRLINPVVRERVQRIAHDVVRYAPLLRQAFDAAKASGAGVESGVAGAR